MSAVLKITPLADRYTWRALLADGSLITKGGDISAAVFVSLIPAEGTGLPQHDLVGVRFVRRFLRQFKRATVGGFDKARYWAEIEANKGPGRIASRAARDAKIAAGVLAMPESTPDEPKKPIKRDEVVQVICCENFRYYVRHSDGTALVTAPDYELHL